MRNVAKVLTFSFIISVGLVCGNQQASNPDSKSEAKIGAEAQTESKPDTKLGTPPEAKVGVQADSQPGAPVDTKLASPPEAAKGSHGGAQAPQKHMGRTAQDIRHEHFGAAGDEHNMEYDHEAILGSAEASHEFAMMSPEEAKSRLKELLLRMDLNGDGQIAKGELTTWIANSLRKQEESYAATKLHEVDIDEDEKVSWSEYLQRIYGYTLEEMKAFENDSRPEMKSFVIMVNDDKEKFRIADRDKTGQLTALEYVAFLYPHSYDYMHEHEIKKALDDLDKDNDTMISFEEYIGKSKPSPDQLAADKENFETFDDNKDGKLDKKEIKEWLLPDPRIIAEDEATHLLTETDVDKNGILSMTEILDRHDLWVGSSATDYGDGLYYHDEL